MATLPTSCLPVWMQGLWEIIGIRRGHESDGVQSLEDEEEL